MRTVLFATLAALLAGSAAFAARPSTLSMPCAEAAALVAARGAVVLTTGTHTYERFVAHTGHCALGERAQSAYAPTLDTPTCAIGYICVQQQREAID